MSRTCGRCQVCCTELQIQELHKPDFKVCPNQFAGGCSIYKKRPESCRVYKCSWLRGEGSDLDRPDRVGVLISQQYSPKYGPWVTLHVQRPKALKLKRVKKRVLELIKKAVVIKMSPEGMVMLGGPAKAAEALSEKIRSEGGTIDSVGQVVPTEQLTRMMHGRSNQR